jgi:hypothetical protein
LGSSIFLVESLSSSIIIIIIIFPKK